MGGVRDGQSMTFSTIDTYVAKALNNVKCGDLFTREQIKLANSVMPIGMNNLPLYLSSGNVKLRNAYQEGADHLPLQFDYQAADCRLFYTPDGLKDPSRNWVKAKAAIWGSEGCVSNSTGGGNSLEYPTNSTSSSNSTGGSQTEKRNVAGSLQLRGGLLGLCILGSILLMIQLVFRWLGGGNC
jgi:hypothetical protein